MRSTFLTVLFTSSLFSNSLLAQASVDEPPLPQSMAALGDSISVGAFAAYSRLDIFKPWTVLELLADFARTAYFWDRSHIEKRHLSWSGGVDPHNRVLSHAYRLKKLNPELRIFIGAQLGADVNEVLEKQVPALQHWSESQLGQAMPDYLTLLVGANDVCARTMNEVTRVEDFESRVQNSLESIFKGNPRAKVMVGAIPQLELLVDRAGPARFIGFGRFSKCQDLWNSIPLCENILRIKAPEERELIARTVKEYNHALERSVEKLNQSFPNQIRLAMRTYDRGFSADELAVDCFHPNISGQRGIAEETWAASWWTSEWALIRDQVIRENPPSKPKSDEEPDYPYEGL